MTIVERFNQKVMPEPMSGCWLWTACLLKGGYGMMGVHGTNELAHRLSWRIHKGEIPDGLCVCHHCDNRSCVNPDHLFLGTYQDNMTDKVRKGRQNRIPTQLGEQSPHSKLTNDDVLTIRRLKSTGTTSTKELSSRYNVSERNIDLIIARKKWKHI